MIEIVYYKISTEIVLYHISMSIVETWYFYLAHGIVGIDQKITR